MSEPHIRASDAERATVAETLGRHLSAGRLTVAEYDERLERAYAARTVGELAPLTADLPEQPGAVTTAPAPRPAPGHGGVACAGAEGGPNWRSWAATSVIVTVIWLISMVGSSGFVYPWPIWVVGPWGAVLLAQTVRGDRDGRDRRRLQP